MPQPAASTTATSLHAEFDRQVATLLDKDYPRMAGLSPSAFTAHLEPLHDHLGKEVVQARTSQGSTIPFLIVVKSALVPTGEAVARFAVGNRTGFTDMADEIERFTPIDDCPVPTSAAYLVVDVDTGAETLNVRPRDALPLILAAGRTPLTTDEGVALVTQFPTVFKTHNAFQALGSRSGDKRIPSFWISKGAPRLGWCWAGNPHTWLGAGSAAGRYGRG